jgi:hypothetical protein
VLRRLEIYDLAAGETGSGVDALVSACRRCGQFIPEVLYSRVGWNLSDAPARLVWEHAFDSPEAYRTYMAHPYHADVLDRYLLHDSPERVVVDTGLGAGLVGYHCQGPVFEMARGVRGLVLLRVSRGASPAEIHRLERTLADGPESADQMIVSVVGANTLGPAWFDGVSEITGRPRFTHLWEQGFAGIESFHAYRHGASALADAERRGFDGWMNGMIEDAVGLHYEIDGTRP